MENHSNWLKIRDDLYELDENNEKIYYIADDGETVKDK
ncbi:Uncharacterised protein [Orientia tsutsugamushi]|uniref:Uncharacterized protein n=1 Tax=Orientia tsutsugamushi TaxID=784 RepID=A0A2R8F0C3_ORITS|nr:Uncharacterised protein [Orientia tsutsugamushi]